MKICSKCGKNTRKPRIRNGKAICPRCYKALLKRLINMLARA